MTLPAEDRLTSWLASRVGDDLIGDDAALLPKSSSRSAVTVDQQIAGVHFLPELEEPAIARRLAAVSASDLAAMGARPRWAFSTVASPRGFVFEPFFEALVAVLEAYGARLAGGDLAASPNLALTLTLIGDFPGETGPVERGTARPGDALWIAGTVGESALGRNVIAAGARPRGSGWLIPESVPMKLARAAQRAAQRHLSPEPQLELGRWLAGQPRAAAIDISDGLAIDLHRLCRASGVGAEIDESAIPLPDQADELAGHFGDEALELALSGGEDYVLLFSLPAATRPSADCRRLGTIVEGSDVLLRTATGTHPLEARGWDHLERRS